jgi:hypothetical protein
VPTLALNSLGLPDGSAAELLVQFGSIRNRRRARSHVALPPMAWRHGIALFLDSTWGQRVRERS